MASTLAGRPQRDAPVPDKGCKWWRECKSCPWAECIPEMTPQRRGDFLAAYRALAGFLARPDRTLTP